MDVLSQAQSLIVEHAFTIGIGLLVAALIAGVVWYWMSRGSTKNEVLKNASRVNEATLDSGPQISSSNSVSQDDVEHKSETSVMQDNVQESNTELHE